MTEALSLEEVTQGMARAIPTVDSRTTGQYGDGIGSENEDRQIELLLEQLRQDDTRYADIEREVEYPAGVGKCDMVLPDGTPVEAKLIRYWRANGDPEPHMYKHVFSPFHNNTLLTDADRLSQSTFSESSGLLGFFYVRSDDDPRTVDALPERYTAANIADKIAQDIAYWYDIDAEVCQISKFEGLQHAIHKQGAVISWLLE